MSGQCVYRVSVQAQDLRASSQSCSARNSNSSASSLRKKQRYCICKSKWFNHGALKGKHPRLIKATATVHGSGELSAGLCQEMQAMSSCLNQ